MITEICACDQVQLALNVFSIGCAGFSVLTPYRPLFIGLTTASLGYTHLKHRCPSPRYSRLGSFSSTKIEKISILEPRSLAQTGPCG